MNVLLSMKPQYVEKVLSGEKKYEFRKRIWKKNVDRVFIYATSPVKRIVASFVPGEIVEGAPEDLWNRFKEESGVPEIEFRDYYSNSTSGFAIEINDIKEFQETIDPIKMINTFHPTVDFLYFLNEGIPLKRNQFIQIPLDITCERIENSYRIKVQSPIDNYYKCPVIKEKGIPFSEHPILRPFDKFLLKGSPNIGKVINIFIFFDDIIHPALLCSVVVTKKRILI
ncbi:MAG TPA: hypothetical protein ENK47_02975, partial [Euryarchaeota archaeon]|nr:hypothetical protein [Euryarchaeota archaeon]